MSARRGLAALLLVGLAACEQPAAPPTSPVVSAAASSASAPLPGTETTYPAPHDSEVARRQGECDHAGELLLKQASLDETLSQTASASYEPRSNRCRVELQARPVDPAQALDAVTRTLYDGDNGQLLGSTRLAGKTRTALILETGQTDFVEANLYIDKQMSRP